VSEELPPSASAQIVLLTGALPSEEENTSSSAMILARDYTWVETATDGTDIWINGVK
jgi:hypothetical protein